MPEEERVVLSPEQEAAQHVLDRKASWWQSMQERRKTCARLDKRYHNYRDDLETTSDTATNEPRANIGVPLAAETVDTAVARAYDNTLGQRPYGRVVGREQTDQDKAEIVQQVIDFQQQNTRFAEIAAKLYRDAFKYGLGVGKLHFKRETKWLPQQKTVFGFPVPGAVEMVERVVFQSPVLEHINIQDVFLPMDAPDIDRAEGIIHRTWLTKQDILDARDGLGLPLYDTAALNTLKTPTSGKDSDANLSNEYTTRKIEQGGLHKDNKYAVLEYTGKLPRNVAVALGGQPSEDFIVTVIDGHNVPLRAEPSPYMTKKRMYVTAKVIDDPGYIWGISIVEFVEKLGLTIDELYNVMMDNQNLIVNKVVYVNELAGVDEADVVLSPGKVIRGKRPMKEAIGVIEFPDLAQSTFLLINMLLGHYKEYTGVTNPVLGQSERGEQTATEIASLVSHSATRLGQFERMLEDSFMRPTFERWAILNQQFIDQEFVIRVFKDSQYQYPKVAPEDMHGVFDYIFEGASRAESQALMAGQIMQALQINATLPVPVFDFIKLGEQLLRVWGWKNVGAFLNPAFQEQFYMIQQMNALKSMGETAQALTPQQQAQAKQGAKNPAKQGNAARPENSQPNTDFRSALTAVTEAALPQEAGER